MDAWAAFSRFSRCYPRGSPWSSSGSSAAFLSQAFDSWIIPLLGFFLLPWTTLGYVAFWDWGSGRHVTGFEWFFVILAFLVDLGSYGQGRRAQPGRD